MPHTVPATLTFPSESVSSACVLAGRLAKVPGLSTDSWKLFCPGATSSDQALAWQTAVLLAVGGDCSVFMEEMTPEAAGEGAGAVSLWGAVRMRRVREGDCTGGSAGSRGTRLLSESVTCTAAPPACMHSCECFVLHGARERMLIIYMTAHGGLSVPRLPQLCKPTQQGCTSVNGARSDQPVQCWPIICSSACACIALAALAISVY